MLFFIAGAKDTVSDEASKETFAPKYKNFEQDLMQEYGIEKEGERASTFIY